MGKKKESKAEKKLRKAVEAAHIASEQETDRVYASVLDSVLENLSGDSSDGVGVDGEGLIKLIYPNAVDGAFSDPNIVRALDTFKNNALQECSLFPLDAADQLVTSEAMKHLIEDVFGAVILAAVKFEAAQMQAFEEPETDTVETFFDMLTVEYGVPMNVKSEDIANTAFDADHPMPGLPKISKRKDVSDLVETAITTLNAVFGEDFIDPEDIHIQDFNSTLPPTIANISMLNAASTNAVLQTEDLIERRLSKGKKAKPIKRVRVSVR